MNDTPEKTTIDAVKATLVMELNLTCPHCNHDFDLFKTRQNEDGALYHQVLDDNSWLIDSSDRLKTTAECPECKADIEVIGVYW